MQQLHKSTFSISLFYICLITKISSKNLILKPRYNENDIVKVVNDCIRPLKLTNEDHSEEAKEAKANSGEEKPEQSQEQSAEQSKPEGGEAKASAPKEENNVDLSKLNEQEIKNLTKMGNINSISRINPNLAQQLQDIKNKAKEAAKTNPTA